MEPKEFKGIKVTKDITYETLVHDYIHGFLIDNGTRDLFILDHYYHIMEMTDTIKEIKMREKNIKKWYPNLVSKNEGYWSYITKKENKNMVFNCNDKIGKALRYDNTDYRFDDIKIDESHYSIDICVKLRNIDIEIILTSYKRKGYTDKTPKLINDINEKISKNNEMANLIKDVYYYQNEWISHKDLMDRLGDKNYTLNDNEIYNINNIIFNFIKNCDDIIYNIDYTNEIHRGLMISLILDSGIDFNNNFERTNDGCCGKRLKIDVWDNKYKTVINIIKLSKNK